MKSTELLHEDHNQILRALKVLEEMAERGQRGEELNERDVRDVLEFLHGFGDCHHQGREEGILFPALMQDRSLKNYHEPCHLIFEHNRQRSLIQGLQDSTLTRKTKDFIYYAGRLIDLLRTHIQEEDDKLFSLMESTLSPSNDERVVQEMKGYDRQWQEKELPGLLQRLDNLELKYFGRSRVLMA